MDNFTVLCRYECKKLLNRKIVWISFALCVAAITVSLCIPFLGSYYAGGELIDTNFNRYQTDKRYSEALSGRAIGQELLEETIAAYRKIPYVEGMSYALTDEYQQYARPYSAIFKFILETTNMRTADIFLTWEPSEDDLYTRRQVWLKSEWEDSGISKSEMDFWQEREAQIEKPIVYQYHEAYERLISCYQTVGLLVLMMIAICLSGVFSEEHTRKTDQIILCTPLGRNLGYWAKMMAGIGFAVISASLLSFLTFVMAVSLHGAEGFDAAFQLIYTRSSDSITCGQAILIAFGSMLFTAILTSIFVMVLSEMLHSNVAALAVSAGLLIMAMLIAVPEQYRLLAQIWDWLPWCFLAPWNVFGKYTLSVFGYYLTSWQAVPIIYLVAGIVIAILGKTVYQRFQVSGR